MKKLLAALLLSVSTVVSAQTLNPTTGTVSVTPNVIDPSLWTPVIPMNSGQLGQVEGSGGGPIPAYNTDTNTIRFSFMPYTVSQIRAIEQVLSGSGIKVSGFNYSWQIYNDLNNGSGTRGSLSVTGQLADKSGNVLESYFQDYSNVNTGPNFQTFSGTETFGKSYNLDSLGYVGLAWTGKDQNFWSGYYGPRVRNTSLTLNYSVGSTSPNTPTTPTTNTIVAGVPTATDIATAASLPPPEAEPSSPPPPPPSNSEPAPNGAPPPPPGSEPSPGSPPPPNSSPTQQSAPSGSPQQSAPSGSPQQTPSGSTPSSGPAPTSLASAGPATPQGSTQQAGAPTSGPSLSSVLTTIKNNEKKEQAIAQAAVSGANEVAQTAVAATEQTALSITAMSVASSQTSTANNNSSSSSNNDASNSSRSSLAMGVPLATPNTQTGALQGSSTLAASMSSMQGASINQSTAQQVAIVNIQTTQSTQNNQAQQSTQNNQIQLRGPNSVEFRTTENDNAFFLNNFLTNRTNPLTEIVENNTRPINNTVEQKDTVVNKSAANNELAGGVDLEKMALQPVGYNSYLQLAMRDVAFYAPKEIYRNQRVIDNQQAVRLLNFASELKHQEMVNQQYGEKK